MRKKKNSGIKVLIIAISITLSLAYLYNLNMFERVAPTVELPKKINWNLKEPLSIKMNDERGIKFIRAVLSDGKNSIVLAKKLFSVSKKEYILDIEFPRTGFVSNKEYFELTVEVIDSSKWNFFSGNKIVKKSIIEVDAKEPELFVINNSYKIIKGGIATVVFKAKDKNLKEVYIETNFGKIFEPTPFYKDNHYISLIAWPRYEEEFKATIVAVDYAGNVSKSRVRVYLRGKKYKVSNLTLKDAFLDGKITDIAEKENLNSTNMSRVEKFKYVNEEIREKNEKIIAEVSNKVSKKMINSFTMKPFYPLKRAAAVASFGDHRYFKYKDELISESYHMGLDFASTAKADVVVSNPGLVVYAKYNGIYGKNIIVSHGLGVYSLYAHNSVLLVKEGELVNAGDVIAKTGTSGLALGDHLHFGMLVQGVAVRPEEWMDKNWMKDNIFEIIKLAKEVIKSST